MGSDQGTQFGHALLSRFNRCFNGRHITLDDDSNVASAKFFFTHDFDTGRLAGLVNCFKDGSEALGFYETQGMCMMFSHWFFLVV